MNVFVGGNESLIGFIVRLKDLPRAAELVLSLLGLLLLLLLFCIFTSLVDVLLFPAPSPLPGDVDSTSRDHDRFRLVRR